MLGETLSITSNLGRRLSKVPFLLRHRSPGELLMMMAGLLVKLGVGRVDKRARQVGRGRVLEHPRRDELIFDFFTILRNLPT